MLVLNAPEAVNAFVEAQGGGRCAPGTFTAIGWADESGKITAGACFYNYNKAQLFASGAVTGKKLPPVLVKACLLYAFNQLKVRRLTFFIKEGNLASRKFVTSLGAYHEATLREAAEDGDILIYALFPENCKLWKRFNVRLTRSAAST